MAVVHVFLIIYYLRIVALSQSQDNTSSHALLKFKNSLSNSDSLTNWKYNDNESPCDRNNIWVGIVCNKDTVTRINLANMGLQGRPNVGAFASFQHLEAISLQNNSFIGPIPAFNFIPTLKAIYASQNQFSGLIPPNYFQPLRSLTRISLSDNKFSGPIPRSLGDLTHLKELHLDKNEFSGRIPDFSEINLLNVVDFSNNKLDGPIPRRMNKFDKKSFQNNPELCGPKASKDCPLPSTESIMAKKLVIAAIVVILLLIIISIKDKQKEENNTSRVVLYKENMNEAVVTIPTNITRKKSSGRKAGYAGFKKTKSMSKTSGSTQGVGEVVMVNEGKLGAFGSQDLMKASAEVLGNGGLGSAYKATLGNGMSVVLKRMKEMNQMSKDVFDGEMRKLGRLKHQNILTPLAYHFRREDKFLVSEYVPKGSLHNVLHGDRGSELNWVNRLKMIKGVGRALSYLHSELASYELPHGNLKSCNVLIGKDDEALVSDYALHPLINKTAMRQSMFAYRSPEAIVGQQVSHKSDVYCLGIIILEVVTGRYPSQYIVNYNYNQKGESGTDVVQWVRSALDENRENELIDAEAVVTTQKEYCVRQMEKLLRIGAACTETQVLGWVESINQSQRVILYPEPEEKQQQIELKMEEPILWDELYSIDLMPSELFLKFREQLQGFRVALNLEFYNSPMNDCQGKLVLKPLSDDRR
ncbi:hypothetical protein QVD17_03409 [Tagetes erecta]|uniref:Protein kinase domain-containing protein n=1 Tax=Tagetes erecta TaxID=13708 RepID=A0AAD8L8A6_TARER|nr:hypothetical protein QVD17_03409 [Tagetes erecta]